MGKKDMILDKGFINHNNYELVESNDKTATLKVNLGEDALNPYGVAHGGLIFGLGDTAMGVVAYNTGKKGVTLSSTINYLKPATGEFLVATMDGNYYYID